MRLLLLTLGRNYSISSVSFVKNFLEKKYEKYESMKSHTFSLEIFSGENFFYLFIYFLEFSKQMI